MMLDSGTLHRGYGINFTPGFEVGRYIEKGQGEKVEFNA